MIGEYVSYIDGDNKQHLALVTSVNDDNTVNIFVFEYKEVLKGVGFSGKTFGLDNFQKATIEDTK